MRLATRVAVVLFTVPAMLCAQAPSHHVAPGDTLRWREVRTIKTHTVMGEDVNMRTEMQQNGVLALARAMGDTVVVWYDTVSASVAAPDADIHMPVPFGRPMKLRFLLRAGGRPEPVSTDAASLWSTAMSPTGMMPSSPGIPPHHAVLIPLPTVALTKGVEWSDSSASATSMLRASGMEGSGGTVYRVVRDTTVQDRPAVVISVDFMVRMKAETTASPQGMTVGPSSVTTGENGIIVFDPVAGRVIGRRTSGEMRTKVTMPSPWGGTRDVEVTATYEHTIELVRP